jgi:hypothetical protein
MNFSQQLLKMDGTVFPVTILHPAQWSKDTAGYIGPFFS